MREKTEKQQSLVPRAPGLLKISVSSSDNFQTWPGTENNGVSLLVLAWSYVLNASFAEKLSLPLKRIPQQPAPQGPAPPEQTLDLTFAQPEECEWWRVLITPGTFYTFDDPEDKILPWAVTLEDLGDLRVLCHCPEQVLGDQELPSAHQAAVYLARLCSVHDLGHQSSAALAAALSFRVHLASCSEVITLPKLRLSAPRSATDICDYPDQQPPPDFTHLSYYMTLGLSFSTMNALSESIFWEPNVSCNHAG